MNNVAAKESLLPPRWLLALIGTAAFVWLLVALKEIVAMLVLGYAIAYAIDPMLRHLERRKISRSVGFFVLCGLFLIAIFLLVITAVPTILREYDKLAENFPEYVRLAVERGGPILSDLRSHLPSKLRADGRFLTDPSDLLSHINGETIHGLISGLGRALLQGYSVTLTVLNFLLLPFIAFYLAVDLPVFHAWALRLFPTSRRQHVAQIAREIDGYVSAFVRGQFTVGTILFTLYCIGLGIIGVELWFLLAVISGFGAIIPYLGFLVGIVLSSIMALATFGDVSHLLQVIGVYLVVQFMEGTFITPNVVGDRVGLSPLVVILAIVAGGQLFGILGVILAVPGAAVARVLMKHLHAWLVTQ